MAWKVRNAVLYSTMLVALLVKETIATADVEIADIWGTLSLDVDQDPVYLKCLATDAEFSGDFQWMVGDEMLPVNAEVTDLGLGEFEQTYNYQPSIEHDGKTLYCRFIERDSSGAILSENEDFLELSITMTRLPVGPINAGTYLMGQPVELGVEFSMYPKPQSSELYWLVPSTASEPEVKIAIGQTVGKYSAGTLEPLGDHRYRSTLVMATDENTDLLSEDVTGEHILVVKVPDETDNMRKIPVVFTQSSKAESSAPPSQKPPFVQQTTKEPGQQSPPANEMGVGMFIIVAIIVMIVLVCLGYCVYQKCCKKEQKEVTRTSSNKQYTAAATEEKNAAV